MTIEEAKIALRKPLAFGDEEQITAVKTLSYMEGLRSKVQQLGEISVRCQDCEGAGHSTCAYCGGRGRTECESCDGDGHLELDPSDIDHMSEDELHKWLERSG